MDILETLEELLPIKVSSWGTLKVSDAERLQGFDSIIIVSEPFVFRDCRVCQCRTVGFFQVVKGTAYFLYKVCLRVAQNAIAPDHISDAKGGL